MPENNIENIQFSVVEGDYWDEEVEISDSFSGDISAYGSWECQVMPSEVLTTDVSAASLSASVSIESVSERTVTLEADETLTDNLVDSGKASEKYYSDLRAEVETGKPQTLAQITWDVKRKHRTS